MRSHVLQLWQELCVRGVIPLGRQHALAATVAGRLLDRSSMVRRHAVCFLATSLDCNPFSAKVLPPSLFPLEKGSCAAVAQRADLTVVLNCDGPFLKFSSATLIAIITFVYGIFAKLMVAFLRLMEDEVEDTVMSCYYGQLCSPPKSIRYLSCLNNEI